MDTVRVAADELQRFVAAAFRAVEAPPAHAETMAETLVEADLEGIASHGVQRLGLYLRRIELGLMDPQQTGEFVRRRGATALLDGRNGLGPVIASRAMQEAVALARAHGCGIVGVRAGNHFGTAGRYSRLAADAGCVGLVLSNTPPAMAPWGGRRPYLGTNPLALGFPRRHGPPVVVDMSSSVVARGQVLLAAKQGEAIPAGWALDEEGRPTTDPQAALRGSLLPLGGAKGAALALAIDILCGVMTGAGFGDGVAMYDDWTRAQDIGHVMVALDVEAFLPRDAYEERLERFAAAIKANEPAPGREAPRLPGERRWQAQQIRRREGIPLPRAVFADLQAIGERLGLPRLEALG